MIRCDSAFPVATDSTGVFLNILALGVPAKGASSSPDPMPRDPHPLLLSWELREHVEEVVAPVKTGTRENTVERDRTETWKA